MVPLIVSLVIHFGLLSHHHELAHQRTMDEALPLKMFIVFDPYTGELVEFRANEATQNRYLDYLEQPKPKAFAISPSQVWAYSNGKEQALAECTSYLRPGEFSCFVADVDGQIVAEEPVWLTLVE
jgi:hypothetical protein